MSYACRLWSLPEASQEAGTCPFASASASVLVSACLSPTCAAGVMSSASASAGEVVTSGFLRLRARAATALAAAVSIEMPASLRQRRLGWLRGLEPLRGRGPHGRDLGCDVVLQDLPRALDRWRRPGACSVRAAPRGCSGAPGQRLHRSRSWLHPGRRLARAVPPAAGILVGLVVSWPAGH